MTIIASDSPGRFGGVFSTLKEEKRKKKKLLP